MISCPKCHNLISYNSYFGAYYCSVCGEYIKNPTKTNADWLRSLSDEELADQIVNVVFDTLDYCGIETNITERKIYQADLIKWMRQPEEEEQ